MGVLVPQEARSHTFCAVDLKTWYSPNMASISSSLGILNRVILLTVFEDMMAAVRILLVLNVNLNDSRDALQILGNEMIQDPI
jgi:hypothetical protein